VAVFCVYIRRKKLAQRNAEKENAYDGGKLLLDLKRTLGKIKE